MCRSLLTGTAFLAAFLLFGCGQTPLKSMYQLRNVDPLSTSPTALRLAIALPQGFRVDASQVEFTARLAKTPTTPAQSHRLRLRPASNDAAMQRLRSTLPPKTMLYAFELHPDAVKTFSDLRPKVLIDKREGSLSVKTTACRETAGPIQSLNATIYIKTAELDTYVPLLKNIDLLQDTPPEDFAVAVPMCAR